MLCSKCCELFEDYWQYIQQPQIVGGVGMTNFEQIKNMSVEEMASEIDRISNYLCDDYGGYGCKECPLNFLENRNCNATEFANWLNSEAEE